MKSTEDKNLSPAPQLQAENEVARTQAPPGFNLTAQSPVQAMGLESDGGGDGFTMEGGSPGLKMSSPASAPVQRLVDPEQTETPAADTSKTREEDDLGRVHLFSNKDNSFTASRWENADGTTTAYAETFKEKLKVELKTEFGKDITHTEVLKMIEDAKKEGDTEKAEEYRIKLFRANQYAMVEALNVDKTTSDGSVSGSNALGRDFTSSQNHEMYGKTSGATYCNIYAYDLVTALGAYVPRVWWNTTTENEAIKAMEDGKEFTTKPKYGTNVVEMNANALNAWFDRVGKYFGWRKATDMEEAQNSANNGNIVVLQAANKVASKSGHIAVILAERDQTKAKRVDGKVDTPLTSQAGSSNWKYKAGSKWWEDSNHKNGGAWIHDGAVDSPLLKPEEMGVAGTVGETTTTVPATTTTPTTKPSTGTTTAPVTNGPTTTTPTSAEGPTTETPQTTTGETTGANKDDKKLTISRGILQMTTEGSFSGGSYDVRYPHFPENLAVYTPIAAGEKIDAKKRYSVTGDRAKRDDAGAYKVKQMLNRHDPADYDTKVSGADKLATGPNNSGVTIGFGYDIGARWGSASDKAKCKADLVAAGISEANANALSDAVSLRTTKAGKKAAELRKSVVITADQAVNLIGVIISQYDANYTKGTVHAAIEEAFSYVNYWKGVGGGKPFVSKMFAAAKDKKGTAQFDAVIDVIDKEGWGGGFAVIKNYLKVIKGKIDAGYDVEFVKTTTLDGLLNGDNDTFDLVKESAAGTYIGKKDYHEQLTGKPSTGGSTKPSTGTTTKPTTGTTTKPTTGAASIITASVGSGGKNKAGDVRTVKQLLYNAGFNVSVNDQADQQLFDAITAFQKKYFSWTPDGLIEPGKSTATKLAEFKNATRPVTEKPKSVAPTETTQQKIDKEYKKFSDGQVGMPDLARSMKVYAKSSGGLVIGLMDKLGWSEMDNFSYALAANSTETELGTYDRTLLRRMSEELDTYMTMSRSANLGQKARIDKVLGSPVTTGKGSGAGTKAATDTKGAAITTDEFKQGEDMLKETKYHAGYAYIAFTGKSGTKYKPGDKLSDDDAKAMYGKQPTWCNQFAFDFIRKVTDTDPFEGVEQLNTSASGQLEFMKSNLKRFEKLTSFEDAWKEANAGNLVLFSTPDHISVAYPTAEKEMQSRDVSGTTYKFGKVIQAGSSHGIMFLNYAWSSKKFANINIFKYKGR